MPGVEHDFTCCEHGTNCRPLPPEIEAAVRKTEQDLTELVPEGLSVKFDRTPVSVLQEIAAQAPPPRTLREILFTHRALAGATAEQITDLMAELKPLFRD